VLQIIKQEIGKARVLSAPLPTAFIYLSYSWDFPSWVYLIDANVTITDQVEYSKIYYEIYSVFLTICVVVAMAVKQCAGNTVEVLDVIQFYILSLFIF
jgi:hypothetical protein